MRLLFPLAVSLTLIGCATTKTDVRNEAQISRYDPANTARVRLITGDTTHAGFISGQTCEMFYNESLLTKPLKKPDGKQPMSTRRGSTLSGRQTARTA
ncbi:hypothetical protein EBI_22298 [Enterocytozoon bieneusi H348]|nr:hypothetical protein EBI_22298 [Enterocytozoon bieneusi H348]|eukprot:XP_002651709.1 hypothetical protein EBI_22298 [Enterocytozoon bieneusi H348]